MNPKIKMNKLLNTCLICALIMLGANTMQAQSKSTVGVKGGLNLSNFYVEDIDDKDARLGFHAGVYGRVYATDFSRFNPRLISLPVVMK